MIIEEITNENKKIHRRNFLIWMHRNYPNIKRPDIIFSNVMLSIKNNIGFSINDLINKTITVDEYQDKYENYFKIIGRKSPKGHASVHKWNAKFFLEYYNDIK